MTPERTAHIASMVLKSLSEIEQPAEIMTILQTAGAAVKAKMEADLNDEIQAEVLKRVRDNSPVPDMLNETVH